MQLGMLRREPNNEQHWESLYKLLRSFVWAIAYRSLSGDREMASDATQETFLRLFRYTDFHSFTLPEQFLAYVATVVRHASVNLKRGAWEHSADLEAAESRQVPTRDVESLNAIARREILDRLDKPNRRLAELLFQGQTLSAIARELGISYSAAGVRVFRLRRRLRNSLTP